MKKILFMGLHRPNRSPSQRYRFEQFQAYLEQQGFTFDYFYIINAKADKIFYSKGRYLAKLWILLTSVFKLFAKSFQAKQYEFVFVQREAFMLGTVFFESLFARKTKMLFDFDDAIWMQVVSDANKAVGFLKDANKTAKLIAMSDMVFAGNSYLQDYALQFNPNSKRVPTVVDTDNYHPSNKTPKNRICIGWSGSFSTTPYFDLAVPALLRIKEKYGDKVYFKLIGDASYQNEALGIQGIAWSPETEVQELAEIDIGIMPLPNDEWTKGKCALKGLLYMSMEQATVLSNVGVNGEVVEDGVNGFLADTEEEWVKKLSLLIEDEALRQRISKAGRQTVLEKYSVLSERDHIVQLFHELIESPRKK